MSDFENIETVLDMSYKLLKNAEMCAVFFSRLDKSLNKDQCGRVQFKTYAIAWRRVYVGIAYDGRNTNELAKKFNVSTDTIKRDIAWYRKSQRQKLLKIPPIQK